jgi:hypothetical protein
VAYDHDLPTYTLDLKTKGKKVLFRERSRWIGGEILVATDSTQTVLTATNKMAIAPLMFTGPN